MVNMMDGLSLRSPLRSFNMLVFLLLTHFYEGQSQAVAPSQPVVSMVGGDAVLPCHLEAGSDADQVTVEWGRPDLEPRFVYIWHNGKELVNNQNEAYKGRVSMSADQLKQGNASLKINQLKISDNGRYRCYIPKQNKEYFVELLVGSVSSPVPSRTSTISLAGLDRTHGSVQLQCESAGWYPEPELLWLDGDGNLLSAGPTETVRGPDDLYTVSSRVTVEKKHNNKFTCRVQQKNIKHTREALIQVTDDFFKVQSSYISIIVSLSVTLAAAFILLILALVLFVRMRIQKSKKMDLVTEKQEELQRLKENNSETNNQLQQEKQKNETAEGEMEMLTSFLAKLQDEKEKFQKTKGYLLDEKLKLMETERKLKNKIQNMIKELDEMNFDTSSDSTGSDEKNQQEEKWMKTVDKLKTELQNMNQELKLAGPITVEEVNEKDRYIRLKNISSEEIKLECWELKLQINDSKPGTYMFGSISFMAGDRLTIRDPYCSGKYRDDVDLPWSDMMKWRPADKLQIKLISNNKETFRLL